MQEERLDSLEARVADMEQDLAVIKTQLLRQFPIDPKFVAERLGLTPAESRIAVALAEGATVEGIAESTGRAKSTVRWFLKRINHKLGIASQVELVRLVLLLPHVPAARDKPDAKALGAHDHNTGD